MARSIEELEKGFKDLGFSDKEAKEEAKKVHLFELKVEKDKEEEQLQNSGKRNQ